MLPMVPTLCDPMVAQPAVAAGAETPGAVGGVSESGPCGSSSTPSTASAASAAANPNVQRRWLVLLQEVEELAPSLSSAALQMAADRIAALAAMQADGSQDGASAGTAVAAAGFATSDDACSVCSMCDPEDEELQPDAMSEEQLARLAELDEQLYVGARDHLWWNSRVGWPDDGGAAAEDASDSDGVFVVAAAGHEQHDALGLSRHARRMHCDYHDLRGSSCPHACMAVDMLQQRRISAVVAAQQRERQRGGDPSGVAARKAMYRAVIKWQWSDPLGGGNRVRLPRCVMHRIRKLFPNPVCRECGPAACDFLDECERRGHYTGFRTADESRVAREGRFDRIDLYQDD